MSDFNTPNGIAGAGEPDIEKLAALSANEQAKLPLDVQVRLLYEMPVEKGEQLFNALNNEQVSALYHAFKESVHNEKSDNNTANADDSDNNSSKHNDNIEDDVTPVKLYSKHSVPIGKRIRLRSDYLSNTAYCNAVVSSIQAVLCKNGINAVSQDLPSHGKFFAFDKSTNGVSIDCHIFCEYKLFSYRIEFKFNVSNQPGRAPLIDWFCADKNFPLLYGCLNYNHNNSEKTIEYSSSFLGAFSEEAFANYFELLSSTLVGYARYYAMIASESKLSPKLRKQVEELADEVGTCLPSLVKRNNKEKVAAAASTLGGNLTKAQMNLLNYLVEHVK